MTSTYDSLRTLARIASHLPEGSDDQEDVLYAIYLINRRTSDSRIVDLPPLYPDGRHVVLLPVRVA